MRRNAVCKQYLAIVLVAALVLGMVPIAPTAAATTASDISGHWAEEVISRWQEQGLISGYEDGTIRPNNQVTRAEFMAFVNRVFKFNGDAEIDFPDVPAGAWYAPVVRTAVAAGYIGGYEDGTVRPTAPITRQEAAAIISRVLGLEGNAAEAERFSDAASIPTWSKGAIGAVAAAGAMGGYQDGSFRPINNITRAEAVSALDRVMPTEVEDEDWVIVEAGTYGPETGIETFDGNVIIQVEGVTLQNYIITGDLIIAEEVGDGDVTLQNVEVQGEMIVRGGGGDSVYIYGGQIARVVIEGTPSGKLRVVVYDVDGLEVIVAEQAADEQIILEGSFEQVTVQAANAQIETRGETTIAQMVIEETAAAVTVTISDETTVEKAVVNGEAPVFQGGKGTVKEVEGTAADTVEDLDDVIVKPEEPQEPEDPEEPEDPWVDVTGIVISYDGEFVLAVGDAVELSAHASPFNASDKRIVWVSSNKSVATVSSSGVVTAVGPGTAIITARSVYDSSVRDSLTFTVMPFSAMFYTGTEFTRSDKLVVDEHVTQTINPDGSITISVASDSYIDSGLVIDAGRLGDFGGVRVEGTGDIDVNLYFDLDGNGFFQWDDNRFAGVGGDAYATDEVDVVDGVVEINNGSTFWLMVEPKGSYTLSELKAMYGPDTPVAIWVGVTSMDGAEKTVTIHSVEVVEALEPSIPVKYYTGSDFWRSSFPIVERSRKVIQEINLDGSITITVSDDDYVDSGFVLYVGPFGGLETITIKGSGDYGCNLYLDLDDDGEFFRWKEDGTFDGVGEDRYALYKGPFGDTVSIQVDSNFILVGGENQITVAELQERFGPDVMVGLWIGVTSPQGEKKSATIKSVTIDTEEYLRADTSWYNEQDDTFTLSTASELKGLARLVNQGNDFSGKTVSLSADIDLLGLEWTPIGTAARPFRGTFDGAGHTVSNLRVENQDRFAGLFGSVQYGTLRNVRINDVTISARESAAALAGTIVGAVRDVHVSNVRIESTHYAGGLIGYSYANVSNCSAEGVTVTLAFDTAINDNGDKAGGLVGYQGEGNYRYENCTADNVQISGVRDVGGLVGASHRGVSFVNCTVTAGTVTADDSTHKHADPYAGGLVGRAAGQIALSGCNVTGTTTVSSYGADYAGNLVGGPEDNWSASAWDPLAFIGWYNESSTTFNIQSAHQLAGLAKLVNEGNDFAGKTIRLTADIDLLGLEWVPVGTVANPFNGTFNGNGKIISNLMINQPKNSYLGLFGVLGQNSHIRDLNIDDVEITGYGWLGALAGFNVNSSRMTIENVDVTGATINGHRMIGGIIGQSYNGANVSIRNCSVTSLTIGATVADKDGNGDKVGGIIGHAGSINLSNNTVSNLDLLAYRDAGGIAGYSEALSRITGNSVTNAMLRLNKAQAVGDAVDEKWNVGAIVGRPNNTAAQLGSGNSFTAVEALVREAGEDEFKRIEVRDIGYTPILADSADSLRAAFASAQPGDIVRLSADITLTDTGLTVGVDKTIILDLAGHVLSGVSTQAAASALITNHGYLVITDTSAAGTGKITTQAEKPDTEWEPGYPTYANNTILNQGLLVIESGRIENVTAEGASYAIDNNSTVRPAIAQVYGGEIVNPNGNVAIRQFANSTVHPNDVEILDGLVQGTRAVWIQLPGSTGQRKLANLIVSGGTLSSIDKDGYNLAVYCYSFGDSFANTNIIITGGVFDGDVALTGGGPKDPMEHVEVWGGRFLGDYGVYSYRSDAPGYIRGGYFATASPASYLAPGFELVESDVADYAYMVVPQ